MGLKERQQIEYVKREVLPEQNQRLKTYLGTEIHYEILWASFETDLDACYSISNLLTFIGNAIEWITRNPLGRAAIAEGVTTILIQNVANAADKDMHLENGALKLSIALSSPDYAGRFQESEFIEFIENSL